MVTLLRGPEIQARGRVLRCRLDAPDSRSRMGRANRHRRVLLEFHPVWITRFLELGFDVKPLGLPREYDGDPTVAVRLGYGKKTYSECWKCAAFKARS